MQPTGFFLKPDEGISLDADETSISSKKAKFIKNLCVTINDNASGTDGNSTKEGDNADTFTPAQSNYLYIGNMVVPDGVNYAIGYKENKDQNKGYVFVWNSKKNHFIYRIKGDGSGCEIIYKRPSLNFQLNPKHFIPPSRVVVQSICIADKKTGKIENHTYIIFCDYFNEIMFVAEEDSVLTDSFNSTTYPYFLARDIDWSEDYITRLGVPHSLRCIGIKPIFENPPSGKTNIMVDKTWQFRLKYLDRWGKPSEHGHISMPWYVSSGSCQKNASGRPRCVELELPAGYATVEILQLEYRNCNGDAANLTEPTDWLLYDSFDKYKDCDPGKQWFEREHNSIAGYLSYDAVGNNFKYIFCGNKGNSAISVQETNRLWNPLPLTCSSVIKIGNEIAIANLIEDLPPFNCDITGKINFEVKQSSASDSCPVKTRKVRIVAVIHNFLIGRNQVVMKTDETNDYVWGGIGSQVGPTNTAEYEQYLAGDYQQFFLKEGKGFPGYFAGTNIIGYSKQYLLNKDGTLSEREFDDGTSNTRRRDISGSIADGFVRLQVWEFDNVPEGQQVFRMPWHLTDLSTALSYEKTSTFVSGKINSNIYRGLYNGGNTNLEKEIIVPCKNDYDNFKDDNYFLVINDLTRPKVSASTNNRRSCAICGYLKDFNDTAISLAITGSKNGNQYTDHNGFYFVSAEAKSVNIKITLKQKCQNTTLIDFNNNSANLMIRDSKLTKDQTDCKANKIKITGVFKDCDGIGLSGVTVLLTRGQYARTDGNGRFTIITHDTMVLGENPTRITDRLIILQNGVCILRKCNALCDICLDDIGINIPSCNSNCDERIFTIADQVFSIGEIGLSRSLKAGGNYEFGAVAMDWMGRLTFIQNDLKDNIYIPTWQETGLQDVSKVFYNIDPTIKFDKWVKKISFWRTRNTNGDYLQWVVEKVEKIDSSGSINNDRPEKIKLYITGLNNYNKFYNFKTNTNYQFIIGDRIEFINKNNGDLFPAGINVLVTDSTDGTYVIIDYDTRLEELKGGEKVQLNHPRDSKQLELFFEVSCPIDVIDGVPLSFNGEIPTFDTYIFRRSIPYKNTNSGDVIRSNVFPFTFEHHSPSDLWGDHCNDRGRVTVKNPYEVQKCAKTKVRVSNAFVSDKVLNGLGRFSEADVNIFDEQEWGSITAMITELNFILFICNHNNFVCEYKDDSLRIDGNNNVRASGTLFSRPEKKIGSNYGCQMFEINTIAERQGIVCFVDAANNGLIKCNFSESIDGSAVAEFSSWMAANIKYILQHNQGNTEFIKFFHGIFDPKKNDYLLTIFKLPVLVDKETTGTPDEDYINNLREISTENNETLAYNPNDGQVGQLKRFYSFTSEYYGSLFGDINDNQLITFKNALPYFHYQVNKTPAQTNFLNFYGVQCEIVFELVLNAQSNAVKKYLWNHVHCRERIFFADRIITEARQISRILLAHWDKRDNISTADFKCDLNTFADPNVKILQVPGAKLFDGDHLYGKWIKVRYVGDLKNSRYYCEFNGVEIFATLSGLITK